MSICSFTETKFLLKTTQLNVTHKCVTSPSFNKVSFFGKFAVDIGFYQKRFSIKNTEKQNT